MNGGKIDLSANFPWQRLYNLITRPETTGAVVKVPVPVPVRKPAWWKKLREYLRRVR
jgi:hypothetical protein